MRVTTFGESHGPGIGVVIDGLPPRLSVDLAAVQAELDRRRPGQSAVGSERRELDRVEVLAGLLDGVTTGAPLCLWVANEDARSADYEPLRTLYRPGHGDWVYQAKYGLRDWRGGGRASGRETVARVAAGAVAKQLLVGLGIELLAHAVEIGGVAASAFVAAEIERSVVRCADPRAAAAMVEAILAAQADGDSVGGIVELRVSGVPAGWGDPVFGKLDALLGGALLGIGAVKAVEFGDGFALARRRGSEANDAMGPAGPQTNHAGGIVAGISNGAEIVVRLAVKPTPSIQRPQPAIDSEGRPCVVRVGGRHDPCIVPRVIVVVEAMAALVLLDAYFVQRALATPLPATRRGAPRAPVGGTDPPGAAPAETEPAETEPAETEPSAPERGVRP